MTFERGLDDAALHAASAAVDESHLPQTRSAAAVTILLDDRRDVARREGVEIDFAFDRNAARDHDGSPMCARVAEYPNLQQVRLAAACASSTLRLIRGLTYVAVTTVLMPPRTEKSPTTVMRRGCRAATRSSRIWLVTCS